MIKNVSYHFVSTFDITAPIDTIWETLVAVEYWPLWWSMIKKLTTNQDAQSFRLSVGTFFYVLTFTMINIEMNQGSRIMRFASTGDLVGTGTFRLIETGGATRVTFIWQVATTKRWMNVTASIAKPLFIQSHHFVMHLFGTGLSKQVDGVMTDEHHE